MTAKSNFGGGNTHWEKQKLGRYEFSETRFLEVMEAVCSDSDKKCHSMLEELEETLERWWKKYYALQVKSDLKDFMCVRRLKVCCPRGTYGGKCADCPGGKRTPCGDNGICQGEGTKAGSGECVCEPGYEGDECERCASGYFQTLPPTPSFPSASTLHCSACHPSCKGACDGEGASACRACKEGWVWFDGVGCSDVDECEDETMCKGNQLCLNTQGGHQCKPCHKACASCTDLTHLHCISCAPAFYRDHFNACLPCHESCQMGCTDNSAFTCLQCKKGWKMSEQGCVDLDECEETGACQHDEYCINTVGSFKCSTCHPSCDGCHGSGSDKCMRCKMGYELQGGLCGDVNECLTNVCAGLNRRCINVPGSYFCECVVGFELDDTGACVPNPSVLSINGDDARSRRSSETHRNTDSDTKRSEEYKRKNTPKTTQKKKKKQSQITLHDSELFYYLLSLLLFALLAYLSTSLMPLQASLTAAFSIFLYHQSSRLDDLLKNSL